MRRGTSLVVLAAAIVVVLASASSAQAAFPGTNGKILFRDNAELWTIEPDGSGLTQLTVNGGFVGPGGASWSPDGSSIVVESGFTVAEDFTILDSGGAEVSRLDVPEEGANPSWSPDGEQIAYEASELVCGIGFPPGCIPFSAGVRVIGIDGSGDRQVVPEGRDPAWSPDGRRIAYADEPNDNSFQDIWVVSADGVGATDLTRAGEDPHLNPHWSPDGEVILYTRVFGPCCSPNGELFTIDADGTNTRRLTTSANHEQSAAWSPDGTKIAFSAGRPDLSGPAGMFVMGIDGTGLTKIADRGVLLDWQAIPNAPPDCSGVDPAPASLWPPNKKFRTVRLAGAFDPDGDAVTLRVTTVSHDEGGTGDSHRGASEDQVLLRATRDPHGDGRVYTIEFEVADEHGASCTGEAIVTVPRHGK